MVPPVKVNLDGFPDYFRAVGMDKKIETLLVQTAIPLLSSNMTEASLIKPIEMLMPFFEGLKETAFIKDYDFSFDAAKSLAGIASYTISIDSIQSDSKIRRIAECIPEIWDRVQPWITNPQAHALIREVLHHIIEIIRIVTSG